MECLCKLQTISVNKSSLRRGGLFLIGIAGPALAGVVVVVALLIPHHLPHRYWAHTALIAMMILLLYDLADAGALGRAVCAERLQDMLLGCTMALIGTAIAFPRRKTKLP